MPTQLDNVQTADAYTDAATARFPAPSGKVNLIIANATVYLQWFRIGPNGRPDGTFSQETFYAPGVYSKVPPFDGGEAQVAGVRFRSYVTATPAGVSARAA